MVTVQLADGTKYLTNDSDQAIVWLPIGVEITFDVGGKELDAPLRAAEADNRSAVPDPSGRVSVVKVYKAFQGLTVTLKGTSAGTAVVTFRDRTGADVGSLLAVVGPVKKHPGMDIDLLADLIGGRDAGKTLAVQRLLFNQPDNLFNQKNAANIKEYGGMACGKVVNGRGKALFGSMSPIFYENPYHEPLKGQVTARSDVKYRPDTIDNVCRAIKDLLATGMPVRVGVLDSPVGMLVFEGYLVSYCAGGHTTLIVGCDNAASKFLYIDTWPGGSKLKYEGGISVATKQTCSYMGIFTARYDKDRMPKGVADWELPNLLRQDTGTEGSFRTAGGNFLEVVAGPVLVGKKRKVPENLCH